MSQLDRGLHFLLTSKIILEKERLKIHIIKCVEENLSFFFCFTMQQNLNWVIQDGDIAERKEVLSLGNNDTASNIQDVQQNITSSNPLAYDHCQFEVLMENNFNPNPSRSNQRHPSASIWENLYSNCYRWYASFSRSPTRKIRAIYQIHAKGMWLSAQWAVNSTQILSRIQTKKKNRQKLFHNASKTNPHHKFETKNLKKINPRYLIGIDGLGLTRAEEKD